MVTEDILALLPKLPPVALAAGIVFGLAGAWKHPAQAKVASKWLIQISIVLLGFWISLEQVAKAGLMGLGLSTAAIVLVVGASWVLTRMLRTDSESGTLLSAGTAICGGSAIAATGSAISASAGAIAASTAIVFLLNAAGVYVYPTVGRMLGLSQAQFGAWAAVGVHDVAGVVAAAKAYGEAALAEATVIKLTRVLWIVPVAMVLRSMHLRRLAATGQTPGGAKARSPFPWFIVAFVCACGLRAVLDHVWPSTPGELGLTVAVLAGWGKTVATLLLSVALFLIGTGISIKTLRTLGWRPIVHGVALWLIVSVAGLVAVRWLVA
jgi:uncharacterized integral membrane protein (TIGR00698 family)